METPNENQSDKSSDRKKAFTLKDDLDGRMREWAAKLNIRPKDFVNRGIEGLLQALESNDPHPEIQFVTLCRQILKKPSISSRVISAFLSICAPNAQPLIEDFDSWHNKFLIELLEQNDAPLTPKLMELFQQQASEMNRLRLIREKEMEKAKQANSGSEHSASPPNQ